MIPMTKIISKKEGGIIESCFLLLLVLAGGAYFDVTEHKIPNWWILSAIFSGIVLAVIKSSGSVGFDLILERTGEFLFRMAIICAGFFTLFLFRMIGAGDIKLAALMCGYLGMRDGLMAIMIGLLAGAFWSLLKMVKEGCFTQRITYLTAYFRRVYHTRNITAYYDPGRDGYGSVIPLGVCFFMGCLVFAVSRSVW